MPDAAVATAAGVCCLVLCQQHTLWEGQLHTRAAVCCCSSTAAEYLFRLQGRLYVSTDLQPSGLWLQSARQEEATVCDACSTRWCCQVMPHKTETMNTLVATEQAWPVEGWTELRERRHLDAVGGNLLTLLCLNTFPYRIAAK